MTETSHAALLRTAIGRRDWDDIHNILRQSWTDLVATNLEDVRTALLTLPPSIANSDPLLRAGRELFIGRGMTTTRLTGTVPFDERGVAEWAQAMDVADRLSIGTAQSSLLRVAGDMPAAADLAARLEQVALSALRFQPDAVAAMLPILRLQWAISCQLAGQHALSNTIFRRAHFGAEYLAMDFVVRNTAGSLALNYALAGELGPAREWLAKWQQTPPSDGRLEEMIRVSGLVAWALIALDELDLAAAAEALEVLGEPRDNEELWGYALFAHCQYALLSGTPAHGLDRLGRLGLRYARWRTPGSDAEVLLAAATVDLHCALGQGNAASAVLRAYPSSHPMLSLARARLALLTEDPVTTLLECARDTSGYTVGHRIQLETLLLEASAAAQLERTDHALASWHRATALADTTGMTRPFALLPQSCVHSLVNAGATPPRNWQRGRITTAFPDQVSIVKLTDRERAVLTEMANGLTRHEIAAKLYVSPNTVKAQTSSLFRKLDAHTRDEALTTAAKLKLLT